MINAQDRGKSKISLESNEADCGRDDGDGYHREEERIVMDELFARRELQESS
jgi:hypothetical protein